MEVSGEEEMGNYKPMSVHAPTPVPKSENRGNGLFEPKKESWFKKKLNYHYNCVIRFNYSKWFLTMVDNAIIRTWILWDLLLSKVSGKTRFMLFSVMGIMALLAIAYAYHCYQAIFTSIDEYVFTEKEGEFSAKDISVSTGEMSEDLRKTVHVPWDSFVNISKEDMDRGFLTSKIKGMSVFKLTTTNERTLNSLIKMGGDLHCIFPVSYMAVPFNILSARNEETMINPVIIKKMGPSRLRTVLIIKDGLPAKKIVNAKQVLSIAHYPNEITTIQNEDVTACIQAYE